MTRPLPATVNVYLPDRALWTAVKAQATRQGLSASQVVALLLRAYVDGEIVVNAAKVGGTS